MFVFDDPVLVVIESVRGTPAFPRPVLFACDVRGLRPSRRARSPEEPAEAVDALSREVSRPTVTLYERGGRLGQRAVGAPDDARRHILRHRR